MDKYETNIKPNLDMISKWVKNGATQKTVAKKLKVSESTFIQYLNRGRDGEEKYKGLYELFEKAKEEPDDAVENALFKRACGYTWTEVIVEERRDSEGKLIDTKTKTRTVEVPPDPTTAMFWLTNRRRDKWKYRKNEAEEETLLEYKPIVYMPVRQQLKEPDKPE